MKYLIKILLVSLLFISCQQKIEPADITKLNGYWEIERVVFEKGEDKTYKINESYDYFRIEKNKEGIRKKVMPQLDGTFLVNNVHENVNVREDGGHFYLDYSTPYSKWSEELISITKDKFVVINSAKNEYHYKKATPLNSTGDGKKIK